MAPKDFAPPEVRPNLTRSIVSLPRIGFCFFRAAKPLLHFSKQFLILSLYPVNQKLFTAESFATRSNKTTQRHGAAEPQPKRSAPVPGGSNVRQEEGW
jgi:hypothetical protein